VVLQKPADLLELCSAKKLKAVHCTLNAEVHPFTLGWGRITLQPLYFPGDIIHVFAFLRSYIKMAASHA